MIRRLLTDERCDAKMVLIKDKELIEVAFFISMISDVTGTEEGI